MTKDPSGRGVVGDSGGAYELAGGPCPLPPMVLDTLPDGSKMNNWWLACESTAILPSTSLARPTTSHILPSRSSRFHWAVGPPGAPLPPSTHFNQVWTHGPAPVCRTDAGAWTRQALQPVPHAGATGR